MLLDAIPTASRSFNFYMIVHGNAKMKSKKGIKTEGTTNIIHTGWDDRKLSKNSIEEEENEDVGIRITPSKMMIRK